MTKNEPGKPEVLASACRLLMYPFCMECPSCKSYFTLKDFCTEMNPFKVKCPECGARLGYTNLSELAKRIAMATIPIFAAGYAASLLIRTPFDTIFLIWVAFGCCVCGFYIVYKKAQFAEVPAAEEDEK